MSYIFFHNVLRSARERGLYERKPIEVETDTRTTTKWLRGLSIVALVEAVIFMTVTLIAGAVLFVGLLNLVSGDTSTPTPIDPGPVPTDQWQQDQSGGSGQ